MHPESNSHVLQALQRLETKLDKLLLDSHEVNVRVSLLEQKSKSQETIQEKVSELEKDMVRLGTKAKIWSGIGAFVFGLLPHLLRFFFGV